MKHALVTGASSGIGRALLPLLSRAGYSLTTVGRTLSEDIGHKIIAADLADPAQVAQIIDEKMPLDLLVNCAGYGASGRFEDIPEEAYRRCWQVNFAAPVALVRHALPIMRKAGRGTIVNVTSGVGGRALPYISPYATAKAALNSFTDGLRLELKDTPIKVLLFSPGPVASGFQKAKQHFGATKLEFPPLNGRDPEWVAERLFRAIESGEERVQLGQKARLIEHLNYWSPKLVDKILANKFKLRATST